jgi:ankyrin repeat protein
MPHSAWEEILTFIRPPHPDLQRSDNALQEALRTPRLSGEPPSGFDNTHLVSILLNGGADPNILDSEGNTALVDALTYDNAAAVPALLIRHGALVSTRNVFRDTALIMASNRTDIDISTIRLMMERGANPNMHGDQGRTALMRASYLNRGAVIRLLIEHGADVNAKDDQGRTVLASVTSPDPLGDSGASVDTVALLKRFGARR